jgi:hypothetical protein
MMVSESPSGKLKLAREKERGRLEQKGIKVVEHTWGSYACGRGESSILAWTKEAAVEGVWRAERMDVSRWRFV